METIEVTDLYRKTHTLVLPLVYSLYEGIFDAKGTMVMKADPNYGRDTWLIPPMQIIDALQDIKMEKE